MKKLSKEAIAWLKKERPIEKLCPNCSEPSLLDNDIAFVKLTLTFCSQTDDSEDFLETIQKANTAFDRIITFLKNEGDIDL